MIVNDLEIILRSTLLEFDKSENYNNEINALGNRVFFWGMNEFLLPPKLYQHNCPR